MEKKFTFGPPKTCGFEGSKYALVRLIPRDLELQLQLLRFRLSQPNSPLGRFFFLTDFGVLEENGRRTVLVYRT
jgi:hypothetical protein